MRVEGWEGALARYLENPAPFAWGASDCALWAAEWVRQATGEDYTAAWRGKYGTEKGAKMRMTRLGYAGVEAIADAHLPRRPVAQARRGDLLLHPSGSLGICNGMKGHFLTRSGALIEDTLSCVSAWGVG